MYKVKIVSDTKELAEVAVKRFTTLVEKAIAKRGVFRVSMAGGSTPRGMYVRLAQPEIAEKIDWSKIQIFWGDERCVPPDHGDSNYRLVKETLLDNVPIPDENVFRVRGELAPEQAANDYITALRGAFGLDPAGGHVNGIESRPRFDLILLGMGKDGHTASLFPGLGAIHETERWVAAHFVDKLDTWRVTLTPVVLNAAANVVFLVSGASKAARIAEVLEGPFRPHDLPAQIVRPTNGQLLWLIDEQAAAVLNKN
ncbi:MAG: 6-phosphogluconolactonase [Anaerolineales bacterium]|nr:6-phosphogluconolactonase [Anaerolineales bacterium]